MDEMVNIKNEEERLSSKAHIRTVKMISGIKSQKLFLCREKVFGYFQVNVEIKTIRMDGWRYNLHYKV